MAPPLALTRAHDWLYARTGGRLGGGSVLLLTTTGRRSGQPRRTPVHYELVDGDLVLVAAAGGAPRPPAWFRNLQADPAVTVQIGGQVKRARAVVAERPGLWAELCERNPRLEAVQRKAGHELPLVRLRLEP